MRRLVLHNFRIVDKASDFSGSVIVEDGLIKDIVSGGSAVAGDMVIDGRALGGGAVLMPAFIDLHAHFREPGFPEKETIESASLAAAAGGFGTVVCMANTKPPLDTLEKAAAVKKRGDALGLIDLYPALCLTKNMEGKELSEISALPSKPEGAGFSPALPLLLSEDGKDVADDPLFLAAMAEARRIGVPVSCHCDLGGENNAVRRAIELGRKARCRIHIAHVSTKEAIEMIRQAKAENDGGSSPDGKSGFVLTCEATPHHIALTEEDARRMGDESFGRVNPSLRTEEDRKALISGLRDGVIDAIATDHAPHSLDDKAQGAPGFSGLETAFAVCLSTLTPGISLSGFSALMSANPAAILGLDGPGSQSRGRIAPGLRADLIIADTETAWTVEAGAFLSRGKNSPFAGRRLCGKILMTIRGGRIVFQEE